MSLDFTIDKYRDLCQAAVNSQYILLTVRAYLTMQNPPQKCIVLRHDIRQQIFASSMNAQKADVVIVYKIRMLIKHYCEV